MFRKFVYPSAVGLLLLIAAGAQAQNVLFEYWMDISGTAVSDLTSNGAYPWGPSSSEYRDALQSKVDWADNTGTRARTYLIPPADGDYTFWVAGDDECQLWLSTDDTAANAKMIARVPGWTPADDWLNTMGGAGGPEQKSAPQSLVAGQKYYIEALMKEGGGGDSVSVAWGGPTIGDGPVLIAPEFFAKFVETRHPAYLPVPASGTVDVTSPLFQWTAGTTAAMHDVYFGTNPEPGAAEFKGRQPFAMYFEVAPLVPGATYYWRVDEIEADGTTIHTGDVWTFTVMPLEAHFPSPGDGALLKGSAAAPKLSWTAGQNVVANNVFFGTDKALVAAGDASVAVSLAQAETSFDPGALQALTTYYWRVDGLDSNGAVQAGAVWSFRLTDKAMDLNTDNWAAGVSAAGPKYLATLIADGVYDIGTFGGEQTYEFVVRSNPDEQEPSMCLIGRRDFGDTKMGLKYEQWQNTGKYGATVFGVKDYTFDVNTAPGEYTHLVFVASAAAGTTDLYVNGELKGSVAAAINLSGKVGIGYGAQNRPPAAPFFDNFDGDIFGVAIYDKALTADEIAANADKYFNPIAITDPNLLIYYNFETGSGSIAIDQSGHSNHGDLKGSPQWVTGILGGCLSLDSTRGDYVETRVPLGIVTNTVTVSGWVKHDVAPTPWSGILTQRATSPGCIGLQHDGKQLKYMWGADQYWQFTSGLEIPNGEWYFAALAISPTQGKLYLNGVAQTATNVAEHVPSNFDGLISVGRDIGFGTKRLMTGLIDEVRFYDKTLTDVEIQRLVLSDVTAPGDVVTGIPTGLPCGGNPTANYTPCGELPPLVIDDKSSTKYLNFGGNFGPGETASGFTVTPAMGATIVTGMTFTTANDAAERDPTAFELSGSNDSNNGPWTVIASGDIVDFAQATAWPRFTMNATAISFDNAVAYKHYQVLFTAIRDPVKANSMQIAEVELLGVYAGPDNLLANGGFESGEIAPYSTYGSCTAEVVTECVGADVPEGPIEGKYCLHIVVPAAGANSWDVGMTDSSQTLVAGKKYTFSAWVKCKSGTLEFRMKPERSADPWEGYNELVATATDTWQEFSTTTDVIPADVTPASPTFHIGFAPGDFWIDDVKLYEAK